MSDEEPPPNMGQHWAERDEADKAEWRSLDRTTWIARARAQFNPGQPDQCHICGKFTAVCQAHHIVPLADQYDRGSLRPNHADHVWLCPNHHALVHLFMRSTDFRQQGGGNLQRSYDLDEVQTDKIAELIRKAREWKPWQRR